MRLSVSFDDLFGDQLGGHSKLALVGWDSIFQLRSRRGLGFRHLHDQNNSFLLKIGFNLVIEEDALWVRVLRVKYGWKEHIQALCQEVSALIYGVLFLRFGHIFKIILLGLWAMVLAFVV